MKIKFDIDCTAREARAFLGLPEVAPMQEAMMAEIQKRMRASIEAMDAQTLIKTWMPLGVQGLEQAQKMFWSQMSRAAEGAKTKAKD